MLLHFEDILSKGNPRKLVPGLLFCKKYKKKEFREAFLIGFIQEDDKMEILSV